jgi:acyl-CoA synthetase (AMP-forming)/AMP-acid ligase II
MIEWLIKRFDDYAQRPFLTQGEAIHTYSELASTIDAYGTYFTEKGVRAGDVVTLEADYSLSAIAALFALFKLKTIVTPITTVSDSELEFRRHEVNARWSLCLSKKTHPELRLQKSVPIQNDVLKQLMEQDCPGLILFSSGSTGKPKAMVHNVYRLLKSFSKKRIRSHRILIFLLFDHIGGLNTLFNGLASGALIVVPASKDANAVGESIQRHKVNLLPASPTFLNLFLLSGVHKRFDLSSLRFITYGTEPMPENLLLRLKKAFPTTSFIQTFGTSETGISQTVSRSSASTQIRINDPDTEYRIVDEELWLRSKTQILGYLDNDMSRFTKDGWFKTGDRVKQLSDGFLKITGRKEAIINVGGEKVSPLEVENTLLEMPEIADCLVYGEQNAITGQNVAAEIVLDANTRSQDVQQLKRKIKQHCRKLLSPYKIPARITFHSKTSFNNRYKKDRITGKIM